MITSTTTEINKIQIHLNLNGFVICAKVHCYYVTSQLLFVIALS